METRKAIKALFPLLRYYPWSIGAIFGLGILSSLFEGISISLLIPFLQSFESQSNSVTSQNGLIQWLNQLFISFSVNQKIIYIPLIIMGLIFLKNCFFYGNLLLLAWLNSRISHRVRSDIFNQLLTVSYSF